MSTDQIVYLVLATLGLITFLMMLMIVMINRIEIKTSKRELNMKMILFYQSKFNQMLRTLDTYEIKETMMPEALYKRYHGTFDIAIKALSSDIKAYCLHNDFVFLDGLVREQVRYKSKVLVDSLSDWIYNIEKMEEAFDKYNHQVIEDSSYLENLWSNYFITYDKMVSTLIKMNKLMNNDALIEVVK